jgi:hypothetical protein
MGYAQQAVSRVRVGFGAVPAVCCKVVACARFNLVWPRLSTRTLPTHDRYKASAGAAKLT